MDDLLPLTPAHLHLLICPRRAGYQLMNTLAARLALVWLLREIRLKA